VAVMARLMLQDPLARGSGVLSGGSGHVEGSRGPVAPDTRR
jgi:hypothetical protein